MNRLPELGATPGERSRKAEAFAREQRIDLASAYSVLLGLMDSSQACSLKQFGAASDDNTTEIPRSGDRSLRASALAFRHDLPMRLAFDVAAGERTLEDALREARRSSHQSFPGLLPSESGNPRGWLTRLAPMAAGLALGGLVVWGSGGQAPMTPTPDPPRPAAREASGRFHDSSSSGRGFSGLPGVIDAPTYKATATQDEQGRVTRISGKTPRSVLDAYCAARGPNESCEAREVVPSQPPRAGARIGLLGRQDEPGMRFALWLRRDERSGEWFAGNGADPLEAQPF